MADVHVHVLLTAKDLHASITYNYNYTSVSHCVWTSENKSKQKMLKLYSILEVMTSCQIHHSGLQQTYTNSVIVQILIQKLDMNVLNLWETGRCADMHKLHDNSIMSSGTCWKIYKEFVTLSLKGFTTMLTLTNFS